MPRELVLGNGEMLVNLDRHLHLRDLYYPYVGWANHVGGHHCRVGIWVEGGAFSWFDDQWDYALAYRDDTLVTDCTATNRNMGIRVKIVHAVLHDSNSYVARYKVENLRDTAREVRLFLSHDFRIDESDIGDTVFYNPYVRALVHFKRDRYFLFGGYVGKVLRREMLGPSQYSCGDKEFRGAEGAWRDAEDGNLTNNPISQGAVDSVGGYSLQIPANGTETVRSWILAGETLEDIAAKQEHLLQRGFDESIDATAVYWFAAAKTARPDQDILPGKVSKMLTRSLLIIRTQCDKRGAIIAANDTDIYETARAHYSYLWPRDGALVSRALDTMGQRAVSRAFFEFCARVLPKDRAALMHKYGPDGTVGASWHPWVIDGVSETPFQEDGSALVLSSLWNHIETYEDSALASQMYARFARPVADFLADYRDPATHLPLPSWDLWEERRGCHIWTVASVIAALRDASSYAASMNDAKNSARYRRASEETLAAFESHFWNDDVQRYARMIAPNSEGTLTRDMTVDASSAALFLFNVLPADNSRVVATMESIGRTLWVKAGAGGIARYEKDYYFRVSEDFEQVPGNPWVICTLWLADWYIAVAKTRSELRSALDLLEWATLCASPSGTLSEQVHPVSFAPLSVSPLTWSHAQFVSSAAAYLDKLATLK